MAEKKIRRTQAERTETTRQALIEATIQRLNSHGYAGATLALIAQAAGVSRGSILHQFGTRAALMTEVVKATYAEERSFFAELIPRSPNRGHKASDWASITWQVLSRPSATAVLEILQGSRSDPELAEQLRPAQAEIERSGMAVLTAFHALDQSNAEDRAIYRLLVASVRGLSLQTLTADRKDLDDAIAMLSSLIALRERAKDAGAATAPAETPTAKATKRQAR